MFRKGTSTRYSTLVLLNRCSWYGCKVLLPGTQTRNSPTTTPCSHRRLPWTCGKCRRMTTENCVDLPQVQWVSCCLSATCTGVDSSLTTVVNHYYYLYCSSTIRTNQERQHNININIKRTTIAQQVDNEGIDATATLLVQW